MKTVSQACSTAVYYAQHHVAIHVGWCDHYVALYYGLAHSGFTTADQHFRSTPAQYRHWGTPPKGALVFWGGGSSGAGHIALSLGGNYVASTDYPRSGRVGVAAISAITSNWGLLYRGWTDVYYGSQGVIRLSTAAPPPASLPNVSLANVQAAARHDPSAPQGSALHRSDVLPVEKSLHALNYLAANYVDGAWGTLTIDAYAKWQRALGYTGSAADGIPGSTSLTRLATATPYHFHVVA